MTVNNMKNHTPERVSQTTLMPIKENAQPDKKTKGEEPTFWRTKFASRNGGFFHGVA